MKQTLIIITAAALIFGLGFWLGRYPLTERKFVSLWARRREAKKRKYRNEIAHL